jgi:fibrinogen beta/gamma subunit family protein
LKKTITIALILINSGILSGQVAGKVNTVEDPAKIGSVATESINKLSGATIVTLHKNCNEILTNIPGSSDGVYTIDPDGSGEIEPFDCYCDMTTDGGGWTLVLLSNAEVVGCPRPYWTEVVNDVNLNGTLSTDITTFDLFLGVKYWNTMGTRVRLDMGSAPSSLSHRAYYDFSLDEGNNYALIMSNESVTINTEGTASPGMFTYHNGRPLSTRDADHDAYSSNCSLNYYESAWWYGACMNGSFWGGGLESYQDAPYWTASGTEYFNYGSIWLR